MDYPNAAWLRTLFVFLVVTTASHQYALGQTSDQLDAVLASTKQKELLSLIEGFEKDFQHNQRKLLAHATYNDWKAAEKQLDGTVVALQGIGDDGTLLYYTTHMDPTSKVSRADALYSGGIMDAGLSGSGMKVGVWDAGVALGSHQEYDNRVFNVDQGEVDHHATLVTGTIVSSGIKQKAKGVAYAAEALTHDWTRDKIEVAEAAAEGLLLSNHSYGIKTDRVPDWYFGAYVRVSQDWDKIMYNAPYYLMVAAAGNAKNSQDNATPIFGKAQDGFDLLLGFTTSKNGLVVAGADSRVNTKGELTEAHVSGYSSLGPTDDGRIKPDLAGDGTSIYSTSASNDKSYTSSFGTSMAAPGITGSLLLLQEYHQQLYGSFMKAATLKGIALHTADDVQEEGPDYKMGWGVINTKQAAEAIQGKDFNSVIEERTLHSGESYSITINANGMDDLSAAISWTDPEGQEINRGNLNASVPTLVNDLDIRITQNGRHYYPWKLDPRRASAPAVQGDNTVDPFERIDVAGASGEYTITVTHKEELTGEAQDFTLIITGAALTACKLSAPEGLQLGTANDNGATVQWNAGSEDTLYEVQFQEEGAANWTTVSTWENSLTLEKLDIENVYSVRVRAVCSATMASSFSEELGFVFNGSLTSEEQEVLSIDDPLSISIFPNPVVNELHIDGNLTPYAEYAVIDSSGNTVKKGDAQANIEVADLASGVYILMVQDFGGIKSAKFFKN